MWHDRSVLVVEDDEDVRQMLAGQIGYELGAVTEVARDGAEALRWVKKLNPTVVILDLNLPTVDGFEVARRLKQDAETRDVGIIAVSALSPVDETRKRALEAGCDEFVPKPFLVDALLDAVHRRLIAADVRESSQ